MRYLTKSRFKLALECPTKLYYTKKPSEYQDKWLDDKFLRTLAWGGYQVGELANTIIQMESKLAPGFTKRPYMKRKSI